MVLVGADNSQNQEHSRTKSIKQKIEFIALTADGGQIDGASIKQNLNSIKHTAEIIGYF